MQPVGASRGPRGVHTKHVCCVCVCRVCISRADGTRHRSPAEPNFDHARARFLFVCGWRDVSALASAPAAALTAGRELVAAAEALQVAYIRELLA
jgi:hypothetical protein